MQYNYFHYPSENLPPYGSVMYFAYRKLDTKTQQILYILDQIKSQIISCTELYNSPEVAQQKTTWWLNEVNNINTNNTSSPQLNKLSQIFTKEILYQKLITDINFSINSHYLNSKDIYNYFANKFLGIETLKALYLNNFNNINHNEILQINANNEIIRHIFCIPKHFHNQILLDSRISPNITKQEFKDIATQWLSIYKTIKVSKNLKPLIKANQIHYKMAKKYIKSINNPFNEALDFSPLALLFYSI
ncbi:MAG: hypothetical protein Kow0076_5010 [Francisella sp.]